MHDTGLNGVTIAHVRNIQLRPTLMVTTTDFSLDDIDDISILPFSYLAGVP